MGAGRGAAAWRITRERRERNMGMAGGRDLGGRAPGKKSEQTTAEGGRSSRFSEAKQRVAGDDEPLKVARQAEEASKLASSVPQPSWKGRRGSAMAVSKRKETVGVKRGG